jgi:hypothetical protein
MKKKCFGGLALSAVMLLSACQLVDTAQIKHVPETKATQNNALIFCKGTNNCEFERLNAIQIMDSDKHKVYREAIQAKILRLQQSHVGKNNALYLSVPAGSHELVVRFYPVSKDRAEKLHLIHKFKAKSRYTLQMYRKRNNAQGTSLLKASVPDPLCVDLKQEQKTIRRFCKPYDALTSVGEFVEQKI